GLNPGDQHIVEFMRKQQRPFIVAVNKIDGIDQDVAMGDFYQLGVTDIHAIAATQGRGVNVMLDKLLAEFPEVENSEQDDEESGIKIAVAGRPNVGKSTLVNRLIGEERVVVYDQPGTTRDSVYIPYERRGQKYTLIDTAGIRRKRSTHEKIEIFSIIKAIDALDRSHVVVLVLDAREGVTEQDATLLGMISDKGRALLIVINKWDGLDEYQKSEVKRKLDVKLSFVNYASVHYISALHGSGVGKLFAPIIKSYTNAGTKHSTSTLNKILELANHGHQPPPVKGRRLKIKYVNQTDVFPPTLTFHGNHLQNVPNAYDRYLKNFFINALKLTNTPVRIEYKSGENPFKDNKNELSARQVTKKRRLMQFIKKRKKRK
ncbi:MAG: ribosome biogenesis GTPase Der, partial [Candidatus Thioglobus sp.]